ncbi:MAG TPA: hypothetical protein VIF62_18540 [Labilithrix sp.]
MSARIAFGVAFFALAACGGSVQEPAGSTQAQAESATAPASSSSDDSQKPPSPCDHGARHACGTCTEHEVCCSAEGQPCAGTCVPDCRPAPDRCMRGSTCDAATGVCLFPPGAAPPPPAH